MLRRELPKPALASWPIWKNVLGALYLWTVFAFLGWLFNSLLHLYTTGVYAHPITIIEIFLGSGWVPFFLWMRWAWLPRRKYARWYRWLGDLVGAIYGLGLILLVPLSYWSVLLQNPWDWVVNGVLVSLFIAGWILPFLSYSATKKLAGMQLTLNLRLLGCGGVASLMVLAGIVGASFGTGVSKKGEVKSAILIVALLFSLVAVLGPQYGAAYLWPYRPWAKEDE